MLKTYAPKGLHGAMLRGLLEELQASPLDASKFLRVTERSVWRWLSDDSAPFAVLATLWHESPRGREAGALDVGNALVIERGLSRATGSALALESARLARVLAISDTGAANEPILNPGAGSQFRVLDGDAVQLGQAARVGALGGLNSRQSGIDLHKQAHARNE